MKAHTSGFKDAIKQLGRQLKGIISYDNTILETEIISITPHYEANLLKSVMKQLDLELAVDIPLETIINCQIGIYVGDDYEMLNFGNYIVYSSEKQEDTNTYKIICYDKMLYAMKQNEDLEITYPITIANYLSALANKIGLSVESGTFYNSSLTIPSELYLGQEYTYRDILDEIAQATGSIIVINNSDQIELKYPTNTNDTIDEEFLKDTNVVFKEKYGPINSIVLSRSAESDNVYLQDTESVEQNGLCEVKIIDNQIMNFNNRSDFLQGILNALDGIEYYKNNLSSFGILYYEVGDFYNVSIGQNSYQCLMLNDEIKVTTGIEEIIHTDMPEQSETDYSKADKTDMKINKTYLIVDKQNQTIESVVSNVDAQNEEIATIRLQYNELLSRISDIADITTSGESSYASVSLTSVNASQPILIKIHPITENIDYLYPYSTLYPSSTLYPKAPILRFINTTTNEIFDWILPTNLWYYNSTTYDELELSYGDGTNSIVTVKRKCSINSSGTISSTGTEITETYAYPSDLMLTDGDYTISLINNTTGYLYVQLMASNIYTTQFATKVELTSEINQSAENILITVGQNYSTTDEMNAAISITAGQITDVVSTKVGEDEIISKINQTAEQISIDASKINLNGVVTANENFKIKSDGSMEAKNAIFNGGNIELYKQSGNAIFGIYTDRTNNPQFRMQVFDESIDLYNYTKKLFFLGTTKNVSGNVTGASLSLANANGTDKIILTGNDGHIQCVSLTQTSLENQKKNFEKLENALDIINNIDIYKYNFKDEDDNNKKHIGFIIGENYKFNQEITSQNNDGVDLYSFISVCCQAIKEQQEQIQQMQKEIQELKGGK